MIQLLIINGDLNLSGTNNIQINPLNGPLAGGSIYKLIQYTGNFNGGISNFNVPGILSGLSNNAATKTIYAIVQGTRLPTNVSWLGGVGGNVWDTASTSNWFNSGTRDIFVSGDVVTFDPSGAANPIVNIVGSVSPFSTLMASASDYTFTGNGSIDGNGSLFKTNSGRLSWSDSRRFRRA